MLHGSTFWWATRPAARTYCPNVALYMVGHWAGCGFPLARDCARGTGQRPNAVAQRLAATAAGRVDRRDPAALYPSFFPATTHRPLIDRTGALLFCWFGTAPQEHAVYRGRHQRRCALLYHLCHQNGDLWGLWRYVLSRFTRLLSATLLLYPRACRRLVQP